MDDAEIRFVEEEYLPMNHFVVFNVLFILFI